MDNLALPNFIVTVALAIWAVYHTGLTHRLQTKLNRLVKQLDHSIERLHRAREAVIQYQKAYLFVLGYEKTGKERDKDYFERNAEIEVYQTELHGLARAIGDDELLRILTEPSASDAKFIDISFAVQQERERAERLHTRINQLLDIAVSS